MLAAVSVETHDALRDRLKPAYEAGCAFSMADAFDRLEQCSEPSVDCLRNLEIQLANRKRLANPPKDIVI
jgi:hypothetical protein